MKVGLLEWLRRPWMRKKRLRWKSGAVAEKFVWDESRCSVWGWKWRKVGHAMEYGELSQEEIEEYYERVVRPKFEADIHRRMEQRVRNTHPYWLY